MSRHQSAKKDEAYVIDLCDEILGLVASRQHRFDFLRDDPGKTGIGVQLPMDAYYEEIRLSRSNFQTSEVLGTIGSSALNRGAGQQPLPKADLGQQQGILPYFCPKLGPKTCSSHHISVDHGLMGCYHRI
jgi:hypothetical protein